MTSGPSKLKSRPSLVSINTNTINFGEDDDSIEDTVWYSTDEEEGIFDKSELEDNDTINDSVIFDHLHRDQESSDVLLRQRTEFEFDDELSDDFEEEVNSATFIMNQKSLVDKAPGALQHSFAHRTIPLQNPFHFRLFQFISVFVICSMTAGIPFGLPAMRQMLVDASIYAGECGGMGDSAEELAVSNRVGCSIQEGRLAIFQVSGWVSWMMGGSLAARSLQHFGPRHSAMIGSILITIGSLMLALSLPLNGDYLIPPYMRMYILPVIILSVGSSFSFLACLHYVRLFPKRTSLLHSLLFMAQDLSAVIFYIMYEAKEFISLRSLLFIYSGLMVGQLIFWKFVFSSAKLPTIRFTVTTWHQRPLLVDKSLPEHISSPYFYLALLFTIIVFTKLYFYMSTFQVQLRILLIPTKKQVNPEDFTYQHIQYFDENGNRAHVPQRVNAQNFVSQFAPISHYKDPKDSAQYFSEIPFLAEQPGGTSSNNLSLRQFIYNPMQPEIFLTDLQEMMYLLIPFASLITIFWMRSSMSDRKISTALLFSLLALVTWGFVQNIFSVKFQACSAMIFPLFRSIFTNGMYDYCERIFGCQHFHFTFWFLWSVAGLTIALLLLPLSYFSINYFVHLSGLFERINTIMSVMLLIIGLFFVWVLKCNKL